MWTHVRDVEVGRTQSVVWAHSIGVEVGRTQLGVSPRRRWGGGQDTEQDALTLLGRTSVPPQVSRCLPAFLRASWLLTVAVPFSVLTCSFHSVSECLLPSQGQ